MGVTRAVWLLSRSFTILSLYRIIDYREWLRLGKSLVVTCLGLLLLV
jgi:hypothetical protein